MASMPAARAAGAVAPAAAPSPTRRHRGRNVGVATVFLAPALLFLGALVVYPIIYSVIRSLYSASGASFVGFNNYVAMFTDPATFTAIKNNIIWVIVAPIACTTLGLVFAVLMEKIPWSTAFKLIIFMPMAISMLAAGVIFRMMFQENPQLGVVNAAVTAVHDAFTNQARFPGARPRADQGLAQVNQAIAARDPVRTGDIRDFPLVGLRQSEVPQSAQQAVAAADPGEDAIAGTVWLDVVQGGGGEQGQIGAGKRGLQGVRVDAVAPSGQVAGHATTAADGTYRISGLDPGTQYRLSLPASNFGQGFQGVSWLGSSLITTVIILSYVWIWAGFAMVMIASGLSSLDRNVLEAARVDGASEWQVFWRITVPMLAPVLTVVMVTLIVNVLKIFDLVYVIPPGVSKPAANVIAVQMWTVSFGGGNNQGLGSALAVLLLILVLPIMIVNARRFQMGGGH